MKKTLLVGIDAACWEYLRPLIEGQRLPTLKALMDSGISGTLHSTFPAHTPAAWGSIITGKNPGKHGVHDFVWKRPNSYGIIHSNASVLRGTPFWKYLNKQGVRVGLVNIPLTHPPDEIEGFIVGGFGAPDSAKDITYPTELYDWIKEKFGEYRPGLGVEFIRSSEPSALFEAKKSHEERQVSMASQLSTIYEVDVLAINLMLFDFANHKMPKFEMVEDALCLSDQYLNQLITSFNPDNVMLISDHGSRRVKGDFLFHVWLRDNGFHMTLQREPKERSKAFNWVLMEYLHTRMKRNGLSEKIIRRMYREAILRLPDTITQSFWEDAGKVLPFAWEHVFWSEEPDYSKSKVYLGTSWSGIIYFNVKGREPNGIIPSTEKSSFAAELVEKLSKIEDPQTSLPLITKVHYGEDLYPGAQAGSVPDLVLDHYDTPWNIVGNPRRDYRVGRLYHRYFVKNPWTFGVHARDGIFVFSGSDFRRGDQGLSGKLTDVTATLLHLYEIPIPNDYDGEVMREVFPSEFFEEHPVMHQDGDTETSIAPEQSYSQEEEGELVERLRMLGYMD